MNYTQQTILNNAIEITPSLIEETFQFTQKSLKNKYIYYYTSLETLVNGILVEKPTPNKEICIWATRWSHMNDKSEVITGLDLLRGGNTQSDIAEFHKKYINNLHVICFSENKDKLQMWNCYGKRGAGVMLAFDFKELLKLYPNHIKPCIYENTEFDRKISTKIANLDFSEDFKNLAKESQVIASILCMIVYISLRKNNAYLYEKEIRLTGLGVPLLTPPMSSKYRVQDGLIIPYIPMYFPKNILKQIWLGPSIEHDRNKAILEEVLKSKGFMTKVIVSNKPYRG